MPESLRVAVCILAQGGRAEEFDRGLETIVTHTPLERVELRLAFSEATHSFHLALGTLWPDGRMPCHYRLPGGVERFDFATAGGNRVWAWQTERRLRRHEMMRLLLHDVPINAEYVVLLEQGVCVAAGWFDALMAPMADGTDCIGEPDWHEYRPGEVERLLGQSWYMGVPPARRDGKPGVAVLREGYIALRSERLREMNGAELGNAVVLGEIAHQLGWTTAGYQLPKKAEPQNHEEQNHGTAFSA